MKKYYEYISVSHHLCCERLFVEQKVKTFGVSCPECDGILTFPAKQNGLATLFCDNAPECGVAMHVNQQMLTDIVRCFMHNRKIQWIDDAPAEAKWN